MHPNAGDGDIKHGGCIGSRPKKVALKNLGDTNLAGEAEPITPKPSGRVTPADQLAISAEQLLCWSPDP